MLVIQADVRSCGIAEHVALVAVLYIGGDGMGSGILFKARCAIHLLLGV